MDVDTLALKMLNAVRRHQKMEPLENINKLAKEAIPLWRIKAVTALEYLGKAAQPHLGSER